MPYDYAALTKACRESNRLNEITGILSYQDGYFLQYIEGPSKQIDRLIVKISSDKRHENIQLLMNSDIAQRNFSTWSMPMGGKLRKDEDFAKFANRYRAIFFDLTDSTRECLNKFSKLRLVPRYTFQSVKN